MAVCVCFDKCETLIDSGIANKPITLQQSVAGATHIDSQSQDHSFIILCYEKQKPGKLGITITAGKGCPFFMRLKTTSRTVPTTIALVVV